MYLAPTLSLTLTFFECDLMRVSALRRNHHLPGAKLAAGGKPHIFKRLFHPLPTVAYISAVSPLPEHLLNLRTPPSMMVPSIDNYDTFGTVIYSETPVIIYFGALWCPGCQTIGPAFEELSREKNAGLKFYKIDTDRVENTPAIIKWQIESVPAFLVYKDGLELDRLNSASRPWLETLIGKHESVYASAEADSATTAPAHAMAASEAAPRPGALQMGISLIDPKNTGNNHIKSLHHYLWLIKQKRNTIIVFADSEQIRSTTEWLKNNTQIQRTITFYSVAEDCATVSDSCSPGIADIMSYAGIYRLPVVLFYNSRVLLGDSRVFPKRMDNADEGILRIIEKLINEAHPREPYIKSFAFTKILFFILNIVTLGAVSSSLYDLWQAQGTTNMTVRYRVGTDQYHNEWEEYFKLKKGEWKAVGIMASLLTVAAAAFLTFMDDDKVNLVARLLSITSMGCSLGAAISSTILLGSFMNVNSIRLAWFHGGALFVFALSAVRGWVRWAIITLQASLLVFVWKDQSRNGQIAVTIILGVQAALYLLLPIGRRLLSLVFRKQIHDTYYDWNLFSPAMPFAPLLSTADSKSLPSVPEAETALTDSKVWRCDWRRDSQEAV
ncbi:hypothetical protein K438DRAFT_1988982 [Mycena galopus ATCC 62051]|nr:hypothetical protein K438DRAFT_1988982 [Mycena galopus ATCC 62051]